MITRYPLLWTAALLIGVFTTISNGPSALAEEDMLPGSQYDTSVPSMKEIIGHDFGERISAPHEVVAYFDALAASRPGNMTIIPYARSWEGRPLFYAVISSKDNIERLEEIKSGMKALSDPRQLSFESAQSLAEDLPGVVWLTYGVHGNEISSTDSAAFLAYHLLSSQGDDLIDKLLRETVILIDPSQNPDGRARFVHNFEIAEGLVPDADRLAAEHQEPWPGGRTNHYLFDMNRDWFALTQPETRGRVKSYLEWFPLAVVDAHEMSGDSSYYFAPPAEPFNPHLTKTQLSRMTKFGQNNARWFDQFGYDYFTREIFDAFYPGYGDSWPALNGAIAMTYEQGSARGLLWRRSDGKVLTYKETVRRHVVSSLATIETVSKERKTLLKEFYEYRRSAIEEGRGGRARAYLIPVQTNRAGVLKLVGNLQAQGIEVSKAGKPFKACGVSFNTGAYIVDAGQPSMRLIRSLLDVDVPISKSFMAEQERRRSKNMRHELYDVTSWSLPLMYGVDSMTCNVLPKVEGTLEGERSTAATAAEVAYIVPWVDVGSAKLLSGALQMKLKVKSADLGFELDGTSYPAGSLIFLIRDNEPDLLEKLVRLSDASGAKVIGTSSSWVDQGANFGSNSVQSLHPIRVALAWDEGTSPYSAGNTRFVLERQIGYPVSVIRTSTMRRADLSRFDVVILPEQNRVGYDDVLGKSGAENLSSFVNRGGVLVGLGSAMRFLSNPDNSLLSTRREKAARDEGSEVHPKEGEKGKSTVAGRIFKEEAAYQSWLDGVEKSPDTVPGVLVRAEADPDFWLSAGLARMNVLVAGRDIYTPLNHDQGVNAVRFSGPDELLVSGYLWEQNSKQLAFKPFVVVEPKGRGLIIGFTASPTTRAYLDGLNMVFANAVLRGPSHARVLH